MFREKPQKEDLREAYITALVTVAFMKVYPKGKYANKQLRYERGLNQYLLVRNMGIFLAREEISRILNLDAENNIWPKDGRLHYGFMQAYIQFKFDLLQQGASISSEGRDHVWPEFFQLLMTIMKESPEDLDSNAMALVIPDRTHQDQMEMVYLQMRNEFGLNDYDGQVLDSN